MCFVWFVWSPTPLMLPKTKFVFHSRPDSCAGVEYTFGVRVSKGGQRALDWSELRFDETACTVSTFGTTLPYVSLSPKVGSLSLLLFLCCP